MSRVAKGCRETSGMPHITTHFGQAVGTWLIGSRAVVAIMRGVLDATDTPRHFLVGHRDVLGRDIFMHSSIVAFVAVVFCGGNFPVVRLGGSGSVAWCMYVFITFPLFPLLQKIQCK